MATSLWTCLDAPQFKRDLPMFINNAGSNWTWKIQVEFQMINLVPLAMEGSRKPYAITWSVY